MGCRESKHAVATDNVITKSKGKNKSLDSNPPVEKPTGDGTRNANEVEFLGNENLKDSQFGFGNTNGVKFPEDEFKPGTGATNEIKILGNEKSEIMSDNGNLKDKVKETGNVEEEISRKEGGDQEKRGELEGANVAPVEEKTDKIKNEELNLNDEKQDVGSGQEEVAVSQDLLVDAAASNVVSGKPENDAKDAADVLGKSGIDDKGDGSQGTGEANDEAKNGEGDSKEDDDSDRDKGKEPESKVSVAANETKPPVVVGDKEEASVSKDVRNFHVFVHDVRIIFDYRQLGSY
ncbi:uncharacterized protein LOC127249076 isoform X2 [Andrographis paniculata]|uniref:uncharacterized protein LOC127249076 isoform X2 n=1 Tax=Andrographis paniculata TaxID=175694 RepID=UPI0021E76996|nr:uncharacterized protein LOC127249076 isoform X2 [Andrographis paniculata]